MDEDYFTWQEIQSQSQALQTGLDHLPSGPGALVIGLVSEATAGYKISVLDEMRQFGAQVLSLVERQAQTVFERSVDELLRGSLNLLAGQILVFKRSMRLGFNSDRPEKLRLFVRLDQAAGERLLV